MNDCIFCKIIKGEITKEFTFQTEELVVFPDINPVADIHLLIVPKKHIDGMLDLENTHGNLLSEVFQVIGQLVKTNNLSENSYRVVINGGRSQHVPHLHFHLLGGQWRKML